MQSSYLKHQKSLPFVCVYAYTCVCTFKQLKDALSCYIALRIKSLCKLLNMQICSPFIDDQMFTKQNQKQLSLSPCMLLDFVGSEHWFTFGSCYSRIHSFIHSFIHQIFIELLVCARLHSLCYDSAAVRRTKILVPIEIIFQWRRQSASQQGINVVADSGVSSEVNKTRRQLVLGCSWKAF